MSSICSESNNRSIQVAKEFIGICQICAIFTVIIACVVNLSLHDDKAILWSSMLSGALGYLLPSPKLKRNQSLSLDSVDRPTPTTSI